MTLDRGLKKQRRKESDSTDLGVFRKGKLRKLSIRGKREGGVWLGMDGGFSLW